MTDKGNVPEIVCIIGPTGSGKNDLALMLGQKYSVEIINFDSRQVYQDLPIITAQPSSQDKEICPHHLYGFLSLRDRISAGRFMDRAGQVIAEVLERGSIPVLVGGTGLYLRALIHGLARIPDVPGNIAAQLEYECRESGVETLFQELCRVDPAYCSSITPRDRQKIIRALGVYRATGKAFSRWHREQDTKPCYNVLKLGIMLQLDRLAPGLERRICRMIQCGAVEEMRRAWEKSGYDHACPAFSGIGCRELIGYIQQETGLEQTVDLWLKNTRAYAKRQLTWFRKEKGVIWISPEEKEKGRELLGDFLGK